MNGIGSAVHLNAATSNFAVDHVIVLNVDTSFCEIFVRVTAFHGHHTSLKVLKDPWLAEAHGQGRLHDCQTISVDDRGGLAAEVAALRLARAEKLRCYFLLLAPAVGRQATGVVGSSDDQALGTIKLQRLARSGS